MKQAMLKKTAVSYFWITVGSILYAIGFDWFYTPNLIGFGGITGVGQVVNAYLPVIPIGAFVFVLNIPLFILGWKYIGGHLLVSSLYSMVLSSAAVAVLAVLNLLLSPARWAGALIGMVCISVPMLLLCLAIPGAFGGGDIKLMAAAGLFLGWQHTLLAMFFGILGGGFYGMYLLAARKADKKDHFAFGPFLCVGIVLALLFGDPVLAWYCRFL